MDKVRRGGKHNDGAGELSSLENELQGCERRGDIVRTMCDMASQFHGEELIERTGLYVR